ncbi:hypothetical protein VMCG_04620 [Cytospora schulzeri]|uniref:Uncharacterized protein n=1 Tax=Cytospora schulzeri TaxID=448051 RepID=A0A423WRJ1_9PEZI|nr:hypothetical protein VMCG_04620 [Valsa malicola]
MSQNNANANPAEGNNDSTPLSYKQQLDQAAAKVKRPQDEDKGGVVDQVVEKVSQYVPAVGNVLGKEQKKDDVPPENDTNYPGAPARPHHDTQIEEFVRDQHRSNTNDLALGEQ